MEGALKLESQKLERAFRAIYLYLHRYKMKWHHTSVRNNVPLYIYIDTKVKEKYGVR
jgi:hypothetical protein